MIINQMTQTTNNSAQPAFITGNYTAQIHAIVMEGNSEDFEKLRGVPGVVLETMPWDVAKLLVDEHSEASLSKLGRHPLDTRQYIHFRQQVCAGCLGVCEGW